MKISHLSVLVVLLSGIQACSGNSKDSDKKQSGRNAQDNKTSVETIQVSRQDISNQIQAYGTIQADDIVKVTPQVSNRVTQIYADLGDTVKQGEPLAKIYDTPYNDQYMQAQAQLEQSRSSFERDSLQFDRQKKLYQQELISSTEFENARATFQSSKAQFQSSKANLTESRENLTNSVIRSPVAGVVLTRNIAKGDLASTGQTAFEVANLTGYETRVYLPLEEWRSARVGQAVSFRVSNEQEISAKGRISRISPRLDPATGLGEVVISLTEKGNQIYQGVLVESVINVATHKSAVVVPRSALVENVQTLIEPESNTIQLNRSYSAFVVKGDSMAIKHELKLGIEQGDKVEITDGLQANDEIVITGQNSLKDSTKVKIAGSNPFQKNGQIPIDQSDSLSADNNKSNSN